MALVFLGAVVIDRRRHLLVGLATAAILLVLSSPGVTQEISFQLSFAAVAGLVIVFDRFWPWWLAWEEQRLVRLRGGRAGWWRVIAAYLAVSVAALAATLPLTAFHFNQLSLMAIAANAVVVPILGHVVVTLGLAAAALHPLAEFPAEACVWLAGLFIEAGTAAVRGFAAVPYAAVRVITPTKLELALVYSFLLACFLHSGRRRMVACSLLVAGLVADIGWWRADRFRSDELRVTFLSVGQGDCAVIELPGGLVMVVDGGGLASPTFDVGERVVAPFLWSRRIATVDILVVTHPQWDHYGGLRFVAESFAPRELWTTDAGSPSPAYARLLEAVRAQGGEHRVLTRGDRRRFGAVRVEIGSPRRDARAREINDRSLVFAVEYAGRRILLTGDIEAAAEAELISVSESLLPSEVVKVPHHGSASSSTRAFVDAVRPRLAVVSSGFDNRYGFPAPRVLGRYAAVRSRILRTDLDGAVEVRIGRDGQMRVRTSMDAEWRALGAVAAIAPGL
jgi:competence protein ComEC